MPHAFFDKKYLATFTLQLSLSFVFLYAGFSSFIRPNDWVGYLPVFLKTFFPALTILKIFSLYELFLAVWLLSGWKLTYSASLTTLTLIGVTLANLGIFDVTFRDVSLAFASLSLVLLSSEKLKFKVLPTPDR